MEDISAKIGSGDPAAVYSWSTAMVGVILDFGKEWNGQIGVVGGVLVGSENAPYRAIILGLIYKTDTREREREQKAANSRLNIRQMEDFTAKMESGDFAGVYSWMTAMVGVILDFGKEWNGKIGVVGGVLVGSEKTPYRAIILDRNHKAATR